MHFRKMALWCTGLVTLLEVVSWGWAGYMGQEIASHPYNVAVKLGFIATFLLMLTLLRASLPARVGITLLEIFIAYFAITKVGYLWVEMGSMTSLAFNLVLLVLVVHVITPIPFIHQLFIVTSINILGVLAMNQWPNLEQDLHRIYLWLVSANVIGAYVANRNEYRKRVLFVQKNELDLALARERSLANQLDHLLELMNHELRNPLAVIQAQADVLRYQPQSPKAQAQLQNIIGAVRSATKLIGELSTSEIRDNSTLSLAHQFEQLIRQTCQAVQHKYPHLQCSFDFPKYTPPVNVPPFVLGLILNSIITNAATHGNNPKGLSIQIRLNPHNVKIRIRDWGKGTERRKVQTQFQRDAISTSNENTPNQGLGLALIDRILRTIGGQLCLVGSPGIGVAVTVSLPR